MSQIASEAAQGETKKESPIEQSLKSENVILHRQLDEAKEKAKRAEGLETEVDSLKQQLQDALSEQSRLKGQVENFKKKFAPGHKLDAKIQKITTESDIANLFSQGWQLLHAQFENGNLRTVWKRENKQDDNSPQDETSAESEPDTEQDATVESVAETYPSANIEIVADEGFAPVPENEPIPEPVKAVGQKMIVSVDSPIPQPDATYPELGPVGQAISRHGAGTVLESMDAMWEEALATVLEELQEPAQILQFKSELLESES